MKITERPPVVFVRGEGSWLIDREGNRFLDFVQGWAVNCLGHCPPEIVRTISAQAQTLINASPAFYTDRMLELADKIADCSCIDRVFFANSGAEANEGAIKLARKWGALHRDGAFEIITTENAFHGRTLATMSASGKPQWEPLFEPKGSGFVKVPFNDLGAIERALNSRTVAIMLEPIQGEAGVVPASRDFLVGVRELSRRTGVLLILDEIQTGIGRTGKAFAYEHAGIEPDILTLGKGLGGGVPLAALGAKEFVCCFAPGEQGGTFNGNALLTAVGSAVLDAVMRPSFLEEVARKGDLLKNRLSDLSTRLGEGEVRGEGLLIGWVLTRADAGRVVQNAFKRGLLLNAPRQNILRFMPALNVSVDEIEKMLSILEAAMAES
ncbi:MAG: acetylornithine transaminase [Nitrospirae bacterium]|nr:acetylornithine transaminase [Nitrospirota bacterium]MCL5286064.1 acetylornithine transaminase [Nitrospirota bacterium]